MDAVLEKHLDELSATIDERMAEIRRLREENKALLAACKQMQKSLNGRIGDFEGMLAAHRALDAAIAKAAPSPESEADDE